LTVNFLTIKNRIGRSAIVAAMRYHDGYSRHRQKGQSMSASVKSFLDHPLALTKADQKRLEKLAALAGRTPQAMLRFVLRDGFATCEEDVAENIKADIEFSKGQSKDHDTVMKSAAARLKESDKRVRQRA
jgi:predicted alpha/beta-hydrolase family hydrolase